MLAPDLPEPVGVSTRALSGATLTQERAEDSLEVLILAVAEGDREAFHSLYLRSSAQLYGIILRIVRPGDRAEDVLQEVYLRIWNHAPDYRPGKGSPMAWMGTIARNRALDWARRRPDPLPLENETQSDALYYLVLAGIDWASKNEDYRALKDCLIKLPKEQRNCILLAFVQGYTHEEISASLATPLGTIKSWIRRGLSQLKGCLDQ